MDSGGWLGSHVCHQLFSYIYYYYYYYIVIKEQQSLLLFEVHDVSVRQAFWEREKKKKKEAVLCNLNIPLVASDPSGISTTILQLDSYQETPLPLNIY